MGIRGRGHRRNFRIGRAWVAGHWWCYTRLNTVFCWLCTPVLIYQVLDRQEEERRDKQIVEGKDFKVRVVLPDGDGQRKG